MIGQYLSNTNENATVLILPKILKLNEDAVGKHGKLAIHRHTARRIKQRQHAKSQNQQQHQRTHGTSREEKNPRSRRAPRIMRPAGPAAAATSATARWVWRGQLSSSGSPGNCHARRTGSDLTLLAAKFAANNKKEAAQLAGIAM